LLHTDPLGESRRLVRRYYLGDFPPDHYADGFVTAARKYVLAERAEPVRSAALTVRMIEAAGDNADIEPDSATSALDATVG
jgi:hypothetical protein